MRNEKLTVKWYSINYTEYSGTRYNETSFFTPVIAKCMEKYLDITNPSYSEQFLQVPWFFHLRLYFGIAIVSRRLLQWMQGLKMD